MPRLYPLILALCYLFAPQNLRAQPTTVPNGKVKLFLDCNTDSRCYTDYIRREMQFVDYVRDRTEASVHLLITTQATGSGGTEYTLAFIGQGAWKADNQTLQYYAKSTDTEALIRAGLLNIIELGMMRYVVRTDLAPKLSLTFAEQKEETAAATSDPWNSWVTEASAYTYFNGERQFQQINGNANLNVNRTTEKLKMEFNAGTSLNTSSFRISDDETVTAFNRSSWLSGLVVKSAGNHFSYGLNFGANTSTYSNVRLSQYFYPAVEYNVFKYRDATREQLRIQYKAGYYGVHFIDTTIYDKVYQDLARQTLTLTFVKKEKWGSITTSVAGSSYIPDFAKNRVSLNGNLSFRIVKGLSLNFGGSYTFIHDQIGLPKSGATTNEVLLQQQQLATSYSYYGNFGLSYRFGSIYNNVVNPRFGGGSSDE